MMKLEKTNSMCAITRRVVDDYNNLSNKAFLYKYKTSKSVYLKRVIKYGDPYMKSPLAKIGKFLSKIKILNR